MNNTFTVVIIVLILVDTVLCFIAGFLCGQNSANKKLKLMLNEAFRKKIT